MSAFSKAETLLRKKPIPRDWEKQLDKIKEEVPESQHWEFNFFYEAGMAASDPEGEQ